MHLVGFILRIYHDARSPERQIHAYLTELHILELCLKYVREKSIDKN